jgi:hypothetical protein
VETALAVDVMAAPWPSAEGRGSLGAAAPLRPTPRDSIGVLYLRLANVGRLPKDLVRGRHAPPLLRGRVRFQEDQANGTPAPEPAAPLAAKVTDLHPDLAALLAQKQLDQDAQRKLARLAAIRSHHDQALAPPHNAPKLSQAPTPAGKSNK